LSVTALEHRVVPALTPLAEFAPHTTTTGDQAQPAVAADAAGNYVVVWRSDDWANGIFGQLFYADGSPRGSEFQVSQDIWDSQYTPAVAMAPDGAFVVAWEAFDQANGGANNYEVFARRYDADGSPLGDEFLVNTVPDREQWHAAVAIAPDHSFVIAWQDDRDLNLGGEIYARRYDAAGVGGATFHVNQTSAYNQYNPAVAMDAAGNVVVAWTSAFQDGYADGVFARRYDAAGTALSGEILVNTTTYLWQVSSLAGLGMAPTGEFVAVWHSGTWGTDVYDVVAQRFAAAGVKLGGEIAVNTYTAGFQGYASVAVAPDGGFVVAWESWAQDGYGVYAQQFHPDGTRDGGEVPLATTTAGNQTGARVAVGGDGNYIAAWTSPGNDGDGMSVVGRWLGGGESLVSVEAIDPTAWEGGETTGAFRITRIGDISSALTVGLMVGGTAVPLDVYGVGDYEPLPSSVTLGPGQRSIVLLVEPYDQGSADDEGPETVTVGIQPNPSAYAVVGGPATVTIVDADDQPFDVLVPPDLPVISVEASDDSATELTDLGAFLFRREGGDLSQPLLVYFDQLTGTTASDGDYDTWANANFPPYVQEIEIPVLAFWDGVAEGDETVRVTIAPSALWAVNSDAATATVTITDHDTLDGVPVVIIDGPTEVMEGNTGGFWVVGTGGIPGSQPVNLATGGTATPPDPEAGGGDYESLPTAAYPASYYPFQMHVSVTTVDDTLVEGDETVELTVVEGTGYTVDSRWATGVMTITDSDSEPEDPPPTPLPVVSVRAIDGWGAEAQPNATGRTSSGAFLLTREGDTASALTINFVLYGTAIDGTDYTRPLTVTIPAGERLVSYIITPLNDSDWEGDETVNFVLLAGERYTVGEGEAVLVLVDDPMEEEQNNGWQERLKVDLDVNNNKTIADAVDGADKYLPGYEGDRPKVSIGTTFNAPGYQGQRLNIVVDGGGKKSGVTRVDFTILNPTTFSGYAENATSDDVTGASKEHDYSFDRLTDKTTYTALPGDPNSPNDNGEIRDNFAFAAFWCKDYGGYCEVQVTVWKGEENVTRTLKIPLDTDGDQIADLWERRQKGEWESQYRLTSPWDALAWQRTDDAEKQDPDGDAGRFVAQKTLGDHIEFSVEYRGFILDGGGSDPAGNLHPGGHKRLSGARKEGLWEVDHEANLGDDVTPADLRAMLDDATWVWTKAGNRVYYIIQQTNLTVPNHWKATDDQQTVDVNMVIYLEDNRGIPGRTDFVQATLKKFFSHTIVLSDTPGGRYRHAPAFTYTEYVQNPDQRGTYFLMSPAKAEAAIIGVPLTAFGAVVFAHEYMHIVINPARGIAPWDVGEHIIPGSDPNRTELMGIGRHRPRFQLGTVQIGVSTQIEIDFKNNPNLQP
jgi:hypothetical protein